METERWGGIYFLFCTLLRKLGVGGTHHAAIKNHHSKLWEEIGFFPEKSGSSSARQGLLTAQDASQAAICHLPCGGERALKQSPHTKEWCSKVQILFLRCLHSFNRNCSVVKGRAENVPWWLSWEICWFRLRSCRHAQAYPESIFWKGVVHAPAQEPGGSFRIQ